MMTPTSVSHTSTKNVKIFGLNRMGQNIANNWKQYFVAIADDACKTCGLQEMFTWITAMLLIVVGYYACTDGIFSCIITLASVVQLVGLIFLLMQVFKHGNFENLSIKMLQCYVWVYICRLCATTREQGYLPIDASGDWCYQLADSCSLVLCLVLIFKARDNPTVAHETFPVLPCLAACFTLAIFVHPCENLGTWTDVVWTTAIYMDTFTMIPQLSLISKNDSVEGLTSHALLCTTLYRVFNLWFWWVSRKELVRIRCPTHLPSYVIISCLFFQVLLLVDFVFFYAKALIQRHCMPTANVRSTPPPKPAVAAAEPSSYFSKKKSAFPLDDESGNKDISLGF